MDISTALLQLQSLAGQKQNELDFLQVAIDQLKGDFAPAFAELEVIKTENVGLKTQNANLGKDKQVLASRAALYAQILQDNNIPIPSDPIII